MRGSTYNSDYPHIIIFSCSMCLCVHVDHLNINSSMEKVTVLQDTRGSGMNKESFWKPNSNLHDKTFLRAPRANSHLLVPGRVTEPELMFPQFQPNGCQLHEKEKIVKQHTIVTKWLCFFFYFLQRHFSGG